MSTDMVLADCGQDAAWFLAECEELLQGFGDAERIDRDLRRFLEAGGRVQTNLRALRANPAALRDLVLLAAHSSFACDILAVQPGFFWQLREQQEHCKVWGLAEMASMAKQELDKYDQWSHRDNALVRFNQFHILRLMLGDVTGALSFDTIVTEIADLAEVCIDAAYSLAVDKLSDRYGQAQTAFTILGFGKLGGRELNYSSDIDLVFVYDERGETKGGSKELDHHAYFIRIGKEMIRILGDRHEDGRLYRVDMRLRPQGASGELVHSYRETIDYYYGVGRAWERQALIKVRPVGGDRDLGRRVLQELRPWIFPQDIGLESMEETRVMRRRIEERADEYNLKTGAGGIRDIEFLVQFYQLTYGGRDPELRSPGTVETLQALVDNKVLPAGDARRLTEMYHWLRTVEHRLQMYEFRQEHHVPEADEERLLLAGRCGYHGDKALQEFDRYFANVRKRVRRLAAKHYLDEDPTYDGFLALLTAMEASDELRDKMLAPYGFRDVPKAYERLRSLTREPFFILSRHRTERNLCLLLPGLLERIQSSPDIDKTLANFQRIVEAVGGRAGFYGTLLRRPRLLDVLMDLCGWSNFIVDDLARFTGLGEEITEDLREGNSPASSDLEAEAVALIHDLSDPVPPLAYLHAREQVMIAIRDLQGAQLRETCFSLSRLAIAVLRALVDRVIADLADRWGHPLLADGTPARYAVLGLGKLGGHEMSYASDMDVILVADAGGRCADSGRDAEQFWIKVTQQLVRMCKSGNLYPIDPRLRPWGDQGPLVTTIPELKQYWSQARELWERMAMTRVAPLAGDGALGLEAATIVRNAAISQELPADAVAQVRDMRGKLEKSVDGRDHVKRGPGGYVDIEFLVHFLSLRCAPEQLPAGASVADTIKVLSDQGSIPPEAAAELAEALATLRGIEARMRLLEGRAISSLPIESDARLRFARCAGFQEIEEMDLALHVARERARHWFDALVS